MFMKPKGQSTFEYAVLLAVIGAAIIAFTAWVRRAASGRYHQSSEQLSDSWIDPNAAYYHESRSNSERIEATTTKGVTESKLPTGKKDVSISQTHSGSASPITVSETETAPIF